MPSENETGTQVIGYAIEMHRELGLVLLESVSQNALAIEPVEAGLRVEQEVPMPIRCKRRELDEGFRADLIVEGTVVLELNAVESVGEFHEKQLQTYFKLRGCRLGYLLNFNAAAMRRGVIRCVNGAEDSKIP